ncbi:MAG: class I SAM-dependent methyltransferase, partial [Chloroflexi bacterium]|nr:class I SAM-dependent methyltransferase [Chloroflexota bacterium]
AARAFRFDPHRELDPNLEIIASYVRAKDVLVDVGGGAGRVGLPLALRCQRLINVDASPGMGQEFLACAQEAGITNAQLVQSRWEEALEVTGDVVFSSDVAYFVRDIVPFIEKLDAAARRRVMITLWSLSPPNRSAPIYRMVYGEEQAPVPAYTDLLPVLWEMGIPADVRFLPGGRWWDQELPQTRPQAVEFALRGRWLQAKDRERAAQVVEANFEQLFAAGDQGFRPLWHGGFRELLITWQAGERL